MEHDTRKIRRRGYAAVQVFSAIMIALLLGFYSPIARALDARNVAGASTQGQSLAAQADAAAGDSAATSSTGTGGDTGSGGSASVPTDPGSESTPTDPGGSESTPTVDGVTRVLLKYDKVADDGLRHYVNEPDLDELYADGLAINQKGETVHLDAYYLSVKGGEVVLDASDTGTDLGQIALDWSTSDSSIATVSPTGLVTPLANGTVRITATVADSSKYAGSTAPSKTVTIVFDGQEGEYVSSVVILDQDGNEMGAEQTLKLTEKNSFYQLDAKVTWVDADGNVTRVENTRNGDKVSSSIKWSTSSQDYLSINEDTGRLKTSEYSANAVVYCDVTGGVGGQTIEATVYISFDSGDYEYNPSDSLTLKVVYEEYPDQVVKEDTWSYSELISKLPSETHGYTVTNGTKYGCIYASGFLFKDVVLLENVNLEDIYQFRFGTSDGYDNPITYQMLYESGSRYYYPNWDISSKAEAQVVPPMLSYESVMAWDKSEIDPSVAMSDGTRFRLVFGVLDDMSANTSFQIYYINSITIVIKGAPPAPDPDPGGGGSDSTPTDPGGNPGTNGSGGGDAGGGGMIAGTAGNGTVNNGSGGSGAATDNGTQLATEQSSAEGQANGSGKQYRVYEMLSDVTSDVGDIDYVNPFSPYLPYTALATIALGGVYMYAGFKRRLI